MATTLLLAGAYESAFLNCVGIPMKIINERPPHTGVASSLFHTAKRVSWLLRRIGAGFLKSQRASTGMGTSRPCGALDHAATVREPIAEEGAAQSKILVAGLGIECGRTGRVWLYVEFVRVDEKAKADATTGKVLVARLGEEGGCARFVLGNAWHI